MLLVLVGCKPASDLVLDPQSGKLVSPIQTPSVMATDAPAPALPLPTVVLSSCAPGTPIALQTGKDVHCPTMMPFPTITSYPTVMPPPGPTATALPFPRPAQDATGSIAYVAHDTSNHTAIYSMSTNSIGVVQGVPNKLADVEQYLGDFAFPSFDGNRIAIVNNVEAGDAVEIFHDNKIGGLFKTSPGGSGFFLNWHPNNHQVLFRADTTYSQENYPGLWLVDADNGKVTVLIPHNPPEAIRDAAVSPDGQEIIYSLQPDTSSPAEVWTVGANGSNSHLLFTAKSSAFAFAWSPDGTKIAYIGSDGLTLVNADGSNPRTLSKNFAIGYRFRPIWSPDSQAIAFVASESMGTSVKGNNDPFTGTNIHLVDVATGKEHSLLSNRVLC